MNNKFKFTADGRKVIVIGNLNSQEKIVQEIFVVGDSEIPSGEHFVVKTLHDNPAISWKEKELAELNTRYDLEKKKIDTELDALRRGYRKSAEELRAKIGYMGAALRNVSEKSFDLLVDYITGNVQWIVVDQYRPEIIPIDKFHVMYEDKLRLVSLFGKDDGTFGYSIGAYHDYSGSTKHFYPFANYEDALLKFKELVLKISPDMALIKLARQYGFDYPAEVVAAWKEKETKIKLENIAAKNKDIESFQSGIIEITNL